MELTRRHQRPRARGRSLRLRRRPAPRMRPSTAREGETSRAHANSAAPKPQTHCAHQWHAVSTDLHRPATATRAHLPVHLCFSAVALRARAAGWRAESCPHLFKPSLFSFSFQLELLRARALSTFPLPSPSKRARQGRRGRASQSKRSGIPAVFWCRRPFHMLVGQLSGQIWPSARTWPPSAGACAHGRHGVAAWPRPRTSTTSSGRARHELCLPGRMDTPTVQLMR